LRDARAKVHGAVEGVLLRVAHQFESDDPRPRDGYEREDPLTEDHPRRSILMSNQGVEDRIVCAALLAAKRQDKVDDY
jgi:hypothetical protein